MSLSLGVPPPSLPLYYSYGGYPKVSTNISYGNPPQSPAIPTIVDLGSPSFWVYGPNAVMYSGSPYLFVEGPCKQTPKPYYNNTASKSATDLVSGGGVYAYGGNAKVIEAHFFVNDTLSFVDSSAYPSFIDQRVALANYTILKGYAQTCTGADYEVSIMGMSPYTPDGEPPSFREDLLESGKISSSTLSMWFDANTGAVKDTLKGSALFGAVPKTKFSGKLVKLALNPPSPPYVGYYVNKPTISVAPLNDTGNARKVANVPNFTPPERCLVDSGFGTDTLPISQADFYNITGMVNVGGYPAFNGSCESIPRDATMDFGFTGINGDVVTVKVPLRNYARGITDYLGEPVCGLSISLGDTECYLGAPFVTGAFLAFNDEKNEIAIAQGGVSSGADKGPAGFGEIVVVGKGEGLPDL